jgi:hypothetical protein
VIAISFFDHRGLVFHFVFRMSGKLVITSSAAPPAIGPYRFVYLLFICSLVVPAVLTTKTIRLRQPGYKGQWLCFR